MAQRRLIVQRIENGSRRRCVQAAMIHHAARARSLSVFRNVVTLTDARACERRSQWRRRRACCGRTSPFEFTASRVQPLRRLQRTDAHRGSARRAFARFG